MRFLHRQARRRTGRRIRRDPGRSPSPTLAAKSTLREGNSLPSIAAMTGGGLCEVRPTFNDLEARLKNKDKSPAAPNAAEPATADAGAR